MAEPMNDQDAAAMNRQQNYERRACALFVADAGEAMSERLIDKVNVWGNSWQDGSYDDEANLERLQRAVSTLDDALRIYRSGTQIGQRELRKRAADVANQAFMLADPQRLEPPR